MPWFGVRITAEQMAVNLPEGIRIKFETFFIDAGRPLGMAMFASPVRADSVVLYFSPETEVEAPSFLLLIGAEKCDRPDGDVYLAVGHQSVRDRFLPGEIYVERPSRLGRRLAAECGIKRSA
jgi:hypothetical protein